MRFDLLEQMMTGALVAPKITLAMVEDGLRRALHADPMKAERLVGEMYGIAFKKREHVYDSAVGDCCIASLRANEDASNAP